ncbi:MAG TPA: type III-B CRISPR module RAMP protein Cmr1 [Ktedonobacteraceae bacterium]|nr:type III-B CRISPR module RAMP protein Cmr1 [Ktedonobacteraceae bacterium]
MQEVTFHLQTITPLFLAGAEYNFDWIPEHRCQPREDRQQGKKTKSTFADHGWKLQAEIRSPSFRGLMRYWLRAAVGGLIDTMSISLKETIQFEQSVFGATDQSSAITLRVADVPKEVKPFERNMTGQDYLLWSMWLSGYGTDYKPERSYYPEGSRFKVILSERDIDSTAPKALPYAVAAMWLLTSLGSIGARSHRCAGSLMVEQVEMVEQVKVAIPNLPFTAARNKEDLQEMLQQGIREIRRLSISHLQDLKAHAGTPFTRPSFDSLLLPHAGDPSPPPYGCHIWILTQQNGSPWNTLSDAMDEIGRKLKDYRSSLDLLDRTAFGLPLNARLPKRDVEVENALKNARRASPLLLRITQLSNGKYVCVAVLFKTPTPPIMDDRNEHILIPEPDYTLLEDWIAKAFHALEVEL